MNPEQPKKNNDEIELVDLMRSIWDGKWIISGITAVIFIIALIYLLITPQVYKGNVEIFPISDMEASNYAELNNSKLIKAFSGKDSKFIDSKKLELLFVQELRTYEGLEASIIENMYIKKIKDETELDFLFRIKKAARSFTISKIENRQSNDIFKQQAKLVLSVTTLQPDLAIKVISDALVSANESVSTKLKANIEKILQAYSNSSMQKLEDLGMTTKRLLKKEELTKKAKLTSLSEQRSLAEALDMDEGILLSKNSSIEPSISEPATSVSGITGQPFFTMGLTAIDKEIKMLLSRKDPLIFIDELIAVELEKDEILQDKTINRIKKLVSATPMGSDKFKSISYDLYPVVLKKNTSFLKTLCLSIFLGGLIGILVLFIRNALIYKE